MSTCFRYPNPIISNSWAVPFSSHLNVSPLYLVKCITRASDRNCVDSGKSGWFLDDELFCHTAHIGLLLVSLILTVSFDVEWQLKFQSNIAGIVVSVFCLAYASSYCYRYHESVTLSTTLCWNSALHELESLGQCIHPPRHVLPVSRYGSHISGSKI